MRALGDTKKDVKIYRAHSGVEYISPREDIKSRVIVRFGGARKIAIIKRTGTFGSSTLYGPRVRNRDAKERGGGAR